MDLLRSRSIRPDSAALAPPPPHARARCRRPKTPPEASGGAREPGTNRLFDLRFRSQPPALRGTELPDSPRTSRRRGQNRPLLAGVYGEEKLGRPRRRPREVEEVGSGARGKLEDQPKDDGPPMSTTDHSDSDREMLLGLYHGYDQARILLARLVARYGSGSVSGETTHRELWGRCHRAGFSPDLFGERLESSADLTGIIRGAHSAALSAFATISDKAEELRREITSRWPSLREDAGGPLPSRLGGRPMEIDAMDREELAWPAHSRLRTGAAGDSAGFPSRTRGAHGFSPTPRRSAGRPS